jgi:hypothetical protein
VEVRGKVGDLRRQRHRLHDPDKQIDITPEALTLQGIDQETPKHLDGHRGHDARCSPASRG